MKSSFDIINVKSINDKVEIKKSKYIKDNLCEGMFAIKDIKKGEPITIYFGDILDSEELIEKYNNNISVMKYIRKGYDFIVDGSCAYKTRNLNLLGVYVNDILKPKSDSLKDLLNYHKSRLICNIEVKETSDFPIYIARKDIKRGQELFVHYGIHYWLLEMGIPPQKLKSYDNKLKKYLS